MHLCEDLALAQRFQLHHTGIKTSVLFYASKVGAHFNCTIQELKLEHALQHFVDLIPISIAPYRN
ncbi:hypothetical protein HMPREF1554_02180 [Porphyromonas gingivalis F0569]|nr:hypothetical protein HMPREF1554_02180 [Porphyromonas gingivalis F0569]